MDKVINKTLKITDDFLMICEDNNFVCCKIMQNGQRLKMRTYTDYAAAFKFIRLQQKAINH